MMRLEGKMQRMDSRPAFETPRKSAAPQDEAITVAPGGSIRAKNLVAASLSRHRIALNIFRFQRILAKFVSSNRTCAAMDFRPTATPVRLAIGEIRLHVCFNHPVQSHMVHA